MHPPPDQVNAKSGLKEAFGIIVERPSILAIALGWSVSIYLLDQLTPTEASASSLARAFAMLPMGTFAAASAVKGAMWLLPLVLIAQAAMLVWIAGKSSRETPVRSRPFRMGLVLIWQGASLMSVFALARLSAMYFAGASSFGALPLIATPVLMTIFAAVLGWGSIRAAAGQGFAPPKDWRVWIYSALSVWLWIFGPGRVEGAAAESPSFAHAFALGIVALQTLLMVGLVGRASYFRTKAKSKVSVGASARAA